MNFLKRDDVDTAEVVQRALPWPTLPRPSASPENDSRSTQPD